jgi:DeoR family transcriptional regulator of aga operon
VSRAPVPSSSKRAFCPEAPRGQVDRLTKTASSLSSVERQETIVKLVEQRKRMTVAQVSEELGVSLATARRDLDELATCSRVERVHGGAIPARFAPPEPPAVHRLVDRAAEKRRIGVAAAALVREGETIFLGSGTTTLEVARQIRARRGLTVVTNSLHVITVLADSADITLICLGGLLRRSEMSLIGHMTEAALGDVRANKVFLGVRGIDLEHGLTNAYLPETEVDRLMVRAGREAIVVADHTKCGQVAAGFVAPLSAVHTLVTDNDAPDDFVEALGERGVRVLRA